MQRWVKFSKYLPSEGWQPVVYTPLNPEQLAVDESLAAEISPETEVLRRHIFEPYEAYRKLTGAPAGKEVNPINSGKKTFRQRLMMFVRGNCFIPDPRCFWIGPSVRYLKKYLKENPVDAIVSTGPPHSMHLIARRLSLSTGLPWVADFRDPWTKMFYFKHLGLTRLSSWIHSRLEKKVLRDASVVVSVSPLVADEFKAMTSTPVVLITNGFDETDFVPAESDGFFNLTHTGLFAADGNPTELWRALEAKAESDEEFSSKLRIRLAGKTDREIIDSINAAGLAANLVDLGYQPHLAAVREQRSASVLMLPLRKEPEYRAVLPGKLFEYLASGTPILGIGQSDGAMASIVRETSTGETFEWTDEAGIAAFVSAQWEAYKRGEKLYSPGDVSLYSRRSLTGRMADLLNSLTSAK